MRDLKPTGTPVRIGGQEYRFLLTINAVDAIQDACNMPLWDAAKKVASVLGGSTEKEDLKVFLSVAAVLMNESDALGTGKEGSRTAAEAGRLITFQEAPEVAAGILEAYGLSMPEKDPEDDDDEEDASPNPQTGR